MGIAFASSGVAITADDALQGGTTARADALGISGDGEGRDRLALGSVLVEDTLVEIGAELSDTVVSGNDQDRVLRHGILPFQ